MFQLIYWNISHYFNILTKIHHYDVFYYLTCNLQNSVLVSTSVLLINRHMARFIALSPKTLGFTNLVKLSSCLFLSYYSDQRQHLLMQCNASFWCNNMWTQARWEIVKSETLGATRIHFYFRSPRFFFYTGVATQDHFSILCVKDMTGSPKYFRVHKTLKS